MKKFMLLCIFINTIVLPSGYIEHTQDRIKQAASYLMNNKKKVAKEVSKELVEDSKIVGGAMLAATAYGVMSNQITAHFCSGYYTNNSVYFRNCHKEKLDVAVKDHRIPMGSSLAKYVLDTSNPTILGLYWGIADTWKIGAFFGICAALACRAGKWPKFNPKDVIKQTGVGLASLSALAAIAGGIGYVSAQHELLPYELESMINRKCGYPWTDFPRYAANFFADYTGYYGGTMLGIGLISWMLYIRYVEEQKIKTNR